MSLLTLNLSLTQHTQMDTSSYWVTFYIPLFHLSVQLSPSHSVLVLITAVTCWMECLPRVLTFSLISHTSRAIFCDCYTLPKFKLYQCLLSHLEKTTSFLRFWGQKKKKKEWGPSLLFQLNFRTLTISWLDQAVCCAQNTTDCSTLVRLCASCFFCL